MTTPTTGGSTTSSNTGSNTASNTGTGSNTGGNTGGANTGGAPAGGANAGGSDTGANGGANTGSGGGSGTGFGGGVDTGSGGGSGTGSGGGADTGSDGGADTGPSGGSNTGSGGGASTGTGSGSGGGTATGSGGGSGSGSGGSNTGSGSGGGTGTGSGGSGSGSTTGSGTDSRIHDARQKGLRGGGAAAGGGIVAGLTGGSVVGTADSLMAAATDMVSAAVVLPPALMISFMFRLSTGKPGNLEKAAKDWSKAAGEIQEAAEHLRTLVEQIPEYAWNMEDRTAYENSVNDFSLQVDALHNYLMAVAVAMMTLAYALFAYAVFAMGMAVYIDALAVLAAAALASVVGSVAYPELLALATTGATITNVSTGILAAAGGIAGAAMFGGASFTADYQGDHGNAGADGAFDRAFKTGAAGSAANLLQNAGNAGLSWLNRSGGATRGGLPGGGTSGRKGFPITEIDLDADRDINRTWTVGGGVKAETPFGESEVAGNVKNDDKGWAGGEVGATHQGALPGDVMDVKGGGKLTWDEDENVGGGFNVGAGHGKSGSEAGYEGNWDPKGDYSDKYEAKTPVFNREGSFAEAKDETPPWDK
ncbi:hypothetical protein [Actinomadura atramentaria]|uniref:hypothetical protein n=1 Tax=Actinomadura atramentaria TaxID=1990 RepID=UPI0003745F12|nr:hypothetical protein [Actinomadura atramentaria]